MYGVHNYDLVSPRPAGSEYVPPPARMQGSGFRVQGAGCRVQGSGFRVQGAGFRVQGAGMTLVRCL